jgi:hypothetical protein
VKTKRIIWTAVFLGITLAAIVMEVIAGVFHPAGTIPWTEYIAQYVPWPVQLAAYVVLAVWLPFHFWRADHLRSAAYRAGRADAIVEATAAAAVSRKATDQNARAYGWEIGRGASVCAGRVEASPDNPFLEPGQRGGINAR